MFYSRVVGVGVGTEAWQQTDPAPLHLKTAPATLTEKYPGLNKKK